MSQPPQIFPVTPQDPIDGVYGWETIGPDTQSDFIRQNLYFSADIDGEEGFDTVVVSGGFLNGTNVERIPHGFTIKYVNSVINLNNVELLILNNTDGVFYYRGEVVFSSARDVVDFNHLTNEYIFAIDGALNWKSYFSIYDWSSLKFNKYNVYVDLTQAGSGDDDITLPEKGQIVLPSGKTVAVSSMFGGAGNDHIRGSSGSDVIFGGDDNDTLQGLGGIDQIEGGPGEDKIYGGTGGDALHGDAGNDTINGDTGQDEIYGGADNDVISGGGGGDVIYGDAGDDRINGDGGVDYLHGGLNVDTLHGGAGDDFIWGDDNTDVIYGDGGNDELYGDAGDDTLWAAYPGQEIDRLDGGQDRDRYIVDDGDIIAEFSDEDISIRLLLGTDPGRLVATTKAGKTTIGAFDQAGVFRSVTIERPLDLIDLKFQVGSGLTGQVTITHASSSAIPDRLWGMAMDRAAARDAAINVIQAAFTEAIGDLAGDLRGKAEDAIIDHIARRVNLDVLNYIKDLEKKFGGDASDVYDTSRSFADIINNFLSGKYGEGKWYVGARDLGAAIADAWLGAGTVFKLGTTVAAELISAVAFSISDEIKISYDEFKASKFDATDDGEVLVQDGSRQTYNFAGGDDFGLVKEASFPTPVPGISPAPGIVFDGGDGSDTICLQSDVGATLDLAHGKIVFANGSSYSLVSIENVSGGAGDDTLLGGNQDAKLWGNAGNDTFDRSFGANDYLDGGSGSDTISFAKVGRNVFVDLSKETRQDSYVGWLTIISVENLVGSSYGDTLKGSAASNILSGGKGNDRIYGREGNDTLAGGAGRDYLTGGAGADTFVFAKDVLLNKPGAADVMLDFSASQGDRIDLQAIDANTLKSGNQAFDFVGSAEFNGRAGQLRTEAVGGDIVISGDVNGDGSADFQIMVKGASAVLVADLML
ncbi:calcium-binding protein [Novosphingobium sp.]|uniref:calcium-binding protein n=1 Tax=Novosphingobium sp. TaxID=1874826 RepID=UPI0038B8AFC3